MKTPSHRSPALPRTRSAILWLAAAVGAVSAGRGADLLPGILPNSGLEIVFNESAFAPWARDLMTTVEQRLKVTAAHDASGLKLLLGMRIHLALHFSDDSCALDAARQIQGLQLTPGDRNVTGLITEAIVQARAGRKDVDPASLSDQVEIVLAKSLGRLPSSPANREAIQRSRDKLAAITEESLLAKICGEIAKIPKGAPCSLELADQLVRIRHQLILMLPLRDRMLRAHDQALAGMPAT